MSIQLKVKVEVEFQVVGKVELDEDRVERRDGREGKVHGLRSRFNVNLQRLKV